MKHAQLTDFTKGWFVGDFSPSLYQTQAVEVAVKKFSSGETEQAHFHKIATEFTVVISGCVRMFERDWEPGSIIIASPGDITSFSALADSVVVVVKIPGATNDKYVVNGQ